MRSRLYHHSKYDCDVKNTLVILPDGSTVVTVVRAEANIVLDTKYGYSEVSNFKVKFTTPSEDGTTIYHYNPITNRIKSGIRTYKHVKIKNTAPKISEELMDAIEGQWGYIGVKSEDINFQEDEVNVYVFNRDGSGQMVSYNKFGTEQWISTYDGCYTVDEKNSTIEFKFDIYIKCNFFTIFTSIFPFGKFPSSLSVTILHFNTSTKYTITPIITATANEIRLLFKK